MQISAVIITFNEERIIGKCLDSLKDVADEIIVVDSGSADKTCEIALEKGASIHNQEWLGYGAQKNYGNSLASFDYILSLDADEVLSQELRQSLIALKETDKSLSLIYKMPRKTWYLTRFIKHSGWYPDYKARLFKRGEASWSLDAVHEILQYDKKHSIGMCKGDIEHYTYKDFSSHMAITQKYTDISSRLLFEKGKQSSILKIIFSPLWAFFKAYILKAGFLDGFDGFLLCRMAAISNFLKYSKLWSLSKQSSLRIKSEKMKIWVVRTDNIGDVMLTLPLCGLIRNKYPQAQIGFVGKPYTKDLIERSEDVDEYIDGKALLDMDVYSAAKELKLKGVDVVVQVFPEKKLSRIFKMAGIKQRIATSHRWFHWIYCNSLVDLSRKKSDLHEACLNTILLSPLGIAPVTDKEVLYKALRWKAMNKGKCSEYGRHIMEGLDSHKNIVLIHPFSNKSGREWSPDSYRELINKMDPNLYKVLITGSAEDAGPIEEKILRPLNEGGSTVNCFSVAGKTTLYDLMFLLASVSVVVACGTGPLHIASAYGTPVIGLYPPIRPIFPKRWAPISPTGIAIVTDTPCEKCGGGQLCKCMKDIKVDKVWDIMQVLLGKSC